ncbi:leucine-rich repeat domain-containing protein [Thermodesulfobacteriota bacterium]
MNACTKSKHRASSCLKIIFINLVLLFFICLLSGLTFASGIDDDPSGASSFSPNSSGTGSLDYRDNPVDWWVVNVSEIDSILRFTLDVPSGEDFDLEVYDSSGVFLAGSYFYSGIDEVVNIIITYSGPYYIKIYTYGSSAGDYTISNEISGVISANEIPGASDSPSSVPAYLNNPDFYPLPGNAGSGGICWATAAADILGYWDRNPYNGIIYWNLVDHGVAPLLQNALPTMPGHDQADVKTLVIDLGTGYYVNADDEDVIIETICNTENSLSFDVTFYTPVSSVEDKAGYSMLIADEIDEGRPVSVGSWGNYFGGPHQVPVIGYIQVTTDSVNHVYIHVNTGDTDNQYVYLFDPSWDDLDLITITPGGTPNDEYEDLDGTDDDELSHAKWIDPEDIYDFRQTHNFKPGASSLYDDKEDWVKFNAQAGRRYTIETKNLGDNCDTILHLEWDGTYSFLDDDDSGDESKASEITWNCYENTTAYIRISEKDSHAGHNTNYDIEVSYIEVPYPPDITGTTPTFNTTPAWNWTSGGGGNGTYRYKLDNDNLTSGTTETTNTSYTPDNALSEGSHTLYVQERDTAGNWSGSGSKEIVVDITPPGVPAVTGATPTSDRTPTWSWTSGGEGNGTYRYKLDDSDLTSGAVEMANTSYTADNALSDGSYTLYVQERDAAGNWSGSGYKTIEVTPDPDDTDEDGMNDTWENTYFGDLSHDGDADSDSDGLTDLEEYQIGTDPTEADTEEDGIPDGWEVQYGLDPLTDDASDDPDGDSYTNLQEYQNGTDPAKAPISQTERAALIALYNSTDGDNWTDNSGWKTPPLHTDDFAIPGTEENWHGITSDGTNILEIRLDNNNLTGSIPAELGNHANLTGLYLSVNQLSGTIPAELGSLANLQYFHLNSNQLSGSIPVELGSLANLQYLALHNNQLSGSIPAELGSLTDLRTLYLRNNQLSGSIPAELGSLTNLQYFDIYNNQLSGSIPAELGSLINLQYLDLNHNQLSGSIPEELGSLANLRFLVLGSNQLSGDITVNLMNLNNLSYLSIEYNALYTGDEALISFLNSKEPDWENTQTLSPEDVTFGYITESSVLLQWTPVTYTADSGGYMVYFSPTPGGPYTLFDMTADKSAAQMQVTGLDLDTTYYFVVQTRTDPHSNNSNTVYSGYSEEVSATTAFDGDGDGMANDWEVTYFGDTSRDGTGDYDGDGLTDLEEYDAGTDPTETDTDNDGMSDWFEITYFGNIDRDGTGDYDTDGLTDLEEYDAGADPTETDTDNDGMSDWFEITYFGNMDRDGTGDSDTDDLTDLEEYQNNTDPTEVDTDEDGMPDGWEAQYGLDPLTDDSSEDPDEDGSTNLEEHQNGSDPTIANIPQTERDALIALYNGTYGDNWSDNSGWKSEPLHTDGFAMPGTENTWNGIFCDEANTTVLWINLDNTNLKGTIPSDLENLINLRELSLWNNQLTGTIPKELGNMINLEGLMLYNNQLTGSIPPELGNLNNLIGLYLHNNQVTGSIPSEIGSLTNLQSLSLYNNQLTGSILPELGNLSSLVYLKLYDNLLNGFIPSELGNLSNLEYFRLSNNQLTGYIPTELGNLTNLQSLELDSNRLTGEIPESLINLTALTNLKLGYNALYTNNESLLTFLNSLDPDWETTQTLAPEDVTIEYVTESTVVLQWTPVAYTTDPGSYIISYSTFPDGPYTSFGTTENKLTTQMRITELELDTTYYFIVQTQTDPHTDNQNTVISEYSEEVSATTVFDADGDGMSNDLELYYFGDLTRDGNGDYDGDGMTDGWEINYDLDPSSDDASLDSDNDGYSNLDEYKERTNPNDPSDQPFPWEIFYPAFIKNRLDNNGS